MAMLEWWAGLSPWIRFGVSLAFLLASTIAWLVGYFVPWGWAIGTILLLFSFPSRSEQKGYHD